MDDTGTRQEFPGGGMRDTAVGKERFELLWTEGQSYEDQMLTRAARWMARGAEKYDSRNWELFDSPEALEHAKASLLRHTYKLLAGETDEDHAAAVWFNSQVIEYVRWKLNSADRVASGPAAKYWRGVDRDSFSYYRQDDKGVLTYVKSDRGYRATSVYRSSHKLLNDPGWRSIEVIPVADVPEWAR